MRVVLDNPDDTNLCRQEYEERFSNRSVDPFVEQQVDGGGEGRPGDAEEDVHPPGFAEQRWAVDAEGRELPQAQTH